MKRYSLAINSFVFLFCFILSITIAHFVLTPPPKVSEYDALRIVNSGEVIAVNEHSFSLLFTFDGKQWVVELETTADTSFSRSSPIVEGNVIRGRKTTQAARKDLVPGSTVLVDWVYLGERGYVAREVIFIPKDNTTLLF